jgi:hypothetical protein
MPAPGERHVGQMAGQPLHRLRRSGAGHQGHRDQQPDRQRQRHQPAALRSCQAPVGDRPPGQVLDHPVAWVSFQLTQPHELRQPAAGQHRAGGRDHRRNRDDRMAERHRLAGNRRRLPRGQHHPRAGPARRQPPGPGPQVSSPERRNRHQRRLRQAPARHFRGQRTCTISNRHAGRHPGLLLRTGSDTRIHTRSPAHDQTAHPQAVTRPWTAPGPASRGILALVPEFRHPAATQTALPGHSAPQRAARRPVRAPNSPRKPQVTRPGTLSPWCWASRVYV